MTDHTPAPASPALPAFAPVPRAKDRSNGWKPHVQRAFIEALAETGSVRAACRRVGRTEHGVYALRRHPESAGFRAAWDAALDLGIRRIEDAAMDRALYGTEETIHYHGEHVATRRRYNERLVMFLLRNRASDRFAAGAPAKGPDAVRRMELKRLKRQWRAEWEAERDQVSPAEVRASIERKVAALKARVLARTSPRAYEMELAARAQVRADAAAGWRPGEPYAPFAEAAAELLPRFLAEVTAEWPPYEEACPPAPDDDDGEDDGEEDDGEEAEWEELAEEKDGAEPGREAPESGPKVRSLKDDGW